jgi:Tol biopolymer transport system component
MTFLGAVRGRALLFACASLCGGPALAADLLTIGQRPGITGGRDNIGLLSGDGRYALVTTSARLVEEDDDAWPSLYRIELATGATVLVDRGPDQIVRGLTGPGAISHDGRFVAFTATSPHLPGATFPFDRRLYRRDLEAPSAALLVDHAISSATEAGGGIAISADGRFVAFEATRDFATGDANGLRDVFVVDASDGTIDRASAASDGGASNGASREPALSGDGRVVAFLSEASNLVPGATLHAGGDVYARDLATDETVHASRSAASVAAHGAPRLTASGRYVAFATDAQTAETRVALLDRTDNSFEQVSDWPIGEQFEGISADGEYFMAADFQGGLRRFARATGTLQPVATDAAGSPVHGIHFLPSLSGDGASVLFASTQGFGAADVTDRTLALRRFDQPGASPLRLVQIGRQLNADSDLRDVSSAGRHVLFATRATNVRSEQGADLGSPVLYRIDRERSVIVPVSLDGTGALAPVEWGGTLSGDGRLAVYSTRHFHPDDAPEEFAQPDVFVHDLDTGEISLASQGSATGELPQISGDGRYVAYASFEASRYVVRRRDRTVGGTITVCDAVQSCFPTAISHDGRYVLVRSAAPVTPDDTDSWDDYFLHDAVLDTTVLASTPSPQFARAAWLSDDGRRVYFVTHELIVRDLDLGQSRSIFQADEIRDVDESGGCALIQTIAPVTGRLFFRETMVDIATGHGRLMGPSRNGEILDARFLGGCSTLVIETSASNLGPTDVNESDDLYVIPTDLLHADGFE